MKILLSLWLILFDRFGIRADVMDFCEGRDASTPNNRQDSSREFMRQFVSDVNMPSAQGMRYGVSGMKEDTGLPISFLFFIEP